MTKRQRRREIDRNNKVLIEALENNKVISKQSKSLSKSRNTLSQTVMLARRYGGATYDKIANKIAATSHSNDDNVKTPVTTASPANNSPIREEPTMLIEVPNTDKEAHKYLESLNF